MSRHEIISLAAELLEWVGIAVILLGAVVMAIHAVVVATRRGVKTAFLAYRRNLGQAILLGLEFLVGADIVRTVSETPTLQGVLILGLIVLIRTFLSFTLEAELTGRWPWQKRDDPPGQARVS